MKPVLCLLASPLLGPSCWLPVADVLSDRGFAVAGSSDSTSRPAPRTAADVLSAYLADIPSDRDVVLIPHSNAGLFVPSLTVQRRVAGYVFVDAGLPLDGGQVRGQGTEELRLGNALSRPDILHISGSNLVVC